MKSRKPAAEPRKAALSEVEHETAGQQDQTRASTVREQHEAAGTQSERFIAKARELGLDERIDTFDAALTKVARHKPLGAPTPRSDDHEDR